MSEETQVTPAGEELSTALPMTIEDNGAPMQKVFGNSAGFEMAQRMAKALAASSIVPEAYRNNVANCLIALEAAVRVNVSPLAVMQNLYVVQGKPGWQAQFVIALVNNCGRFKPLKFHVEGKDASLSCYAYTEDMEGQRIEGPAVTMKMAQLEGWLDKNGSKWKTMPEVMIRYRAASFFSRLYAPDVLLGMHSADELEDASSYGAIPHLPEPGETKADSIKARIAKQATREPGEETVELELEPAGEQ